MAIAFVQSNTSSDLDTVALTGVGAGNLIVLYAKWEDVVGSCTVTDGTTSLTMGTSNSAAIGPCSHFGWLLSANSGNKTYTVTFPASAAFKRILIAEFSYSGTAAFDAETSTRSNATSITSGNITTTGTDEVVFGSYAEYSSLTRSAHQINGVAADAVITAATNTDMWYRIVSATFTGQATATLADAGDWTCHIIGFKATAAAGAVGVLRHRGVGRGMGRGMFRGVG